MNEALNQILKDTSRSFYQTLRVLPAAIRPQISLAYLLARATDTIADTEIIPAQQRLDALNQLRQRILGKNDTALNFGDLPAKQGSPAERILLERCEEAIAVLDQQPPADKQLIRDVLVIITGGQELDLRRFADASAQNIVALANADELDDYTYRVAGCVGEFWTKMCRAHLFPHAKLNDDTLLSRGVRFGKGLQLVNILRDLPSDLRQGRCYIPIDELISAGLTPKDLLDAANEPNFRPLYNRLLANAEAHLDAGWEYTNALPWTCARVRLGCAWPILIGARTLALLRTNNVLDATHRLKVSRSEVKSIIAQTVIKYPFPPVWRNLYQKAKPSA